jgi:hypothetical protein
VLLVEPPDSTVFFLPSVLQFIFVDVLFLRESSMWVMFTSHQFLRKVFFFVFCSWVTNMYEIGRSLKLV